MLICSFQNISLSQNSDFAKAEQYLKRADSLSSLAQYRNAILNCKRAMNIFQNSKPIPVAKIVSTYRTLAYYFRKNGNYKESEFFQLKSIKLAQQKLPGTHEELIKALNGYGVLLLINGEYHRSIEYLEKALTLCTQSNCSDLAVQLNNLGIAHENLGQFDLARLYYIKALNYNKTEFGKWSLPASDNYINLGTLAYKIGKLDKAIAYFDTSLLIYDRVLPFQHQDYAALYNNYGAVYNKKGDYRKSIEYLDKALRNYEFHYGNRHPEVANAYSNTGILFLERGDLDKALTYFERCWLIRSSIFGDSHHFTAKTCTSIGNVYLAKKNYEKAYFWLNKALTNLIANADSPVNEIVDARTSFGNYFEQLGNYDDALNQYKLAYLSFAKDQTLQVSDFTNTLSKIGNIHILKEEYESARKYIYTALARTIEFPGHSRHDIASLYRLLAQSFPDDEHCALEYSDSAFVALNYNLNQPYEFENASSHLELLRNLETRGNLIMEFYFNSADLRQLKTADSIFNISYQLIDYIRSTLEEPGSRQALMDNFFKVYEQGILTKYLLYKSTGKKSHLESAFQVVERSNSTLLLEAIRSVQAERFSDLPDSLLTKERQLKIDISYLERLRFQLSYSGTSTKQDSRNLEDKIYKLKQDYNRLLDIYKLHYPKYFELKYKTEVCSIDDIRNKVLSRGQVLINYFTGETHIFIFIIDQTSIKVKRLRKNFPLEAWIEELRSSISTFNPANQSAKFLNQKYTGIAFEIYDKIFRPIEPSLSSRNLVIIPGGVMGYIPFDVLLTSQPENYNLYDNFDFLIKKYKISYAYSATSALELFEKSSKTGGFMAFAPGYSSPFIDSAGSPTDALQPLIYNVQEAKSIHRIMKGRLYTGADATVIQFLEKAPKANLIHLAAHGIANDIDSEYSYLAFTQNADENNESLLYVKNLYNVRLKAELVVLSACETGIGELQRGEGIISLARGFSFAGAKSIVTTLWRIDDNTSSEIMVDFYKNLISGNSKETALRNAKLTYLEKRKGSNYTHPLFWAAFVPVGNMEPVSTKGLPWWSWIVFILSSALLLIIGRRFLKNRASK
jgi:CHAT domain-containing protein/tetratricopeptide (TPR) repeat protein